MLKKILYKIISYLFGIDIKQLIDKNASNQIEIEALRNSKHKLETLNESVLFSLNEQKEVLLSKEKEFDEKHQIAINQIGNLKSEIEAVQKNANLLKLENLALLEKIEYEKGQHKESVETYRKNESEQQESIRSLKELVSDQQLEISNAKCKSQEIEKLNETIACFKEQISNLKSKPEQCLKEVVTAKQLESIHKMPFENDSLQMADGVVVHKGMNIGKRTEKEFDIESNDFQYQGEFPFDVVSLSRDSIQFPDVFYPKKGTPVLKFHEVKSTTTVGVTEPLLVDSLKVLNDLVPEVVILQNTALSIRNRDYSYRPDIALYWQKYNLFIDIEIDEPYDLVSRDPLHYKGSSDCLRNLYFVSQGWVVIRFCEEQVIKSASGCVSYILSVLNKLTRDNALTELNNEQTTEKKSRWTYEEAKKMEAERFREQYLNMDIDALKLNEVENDRAFTAFQGIPPAGDILPEIEYTELESKLKSIQSKYIRVTYSDYMQSLLENYELDTQNYVKGIKGFDVVEEGYAFIPLDRINDIEGLNSPFKSSLYERKSISDETIHKLVNEAIYNFNPIRIEYKDAKDAITFRNIAFMDYAGFSEKYFCDNIWKKYYEPKGSMIEAYCMLRNAQRHFYTSRMQTVQVYNIKYIDRGHFDSFSESLWYTLMQNDFQLCEHIVELTPNTILETNIAARCNYAHYLLLSGNTEDAVKIYQEHIGMQSNQKLIWKQIVLTDFEKLSTVNEGYKSRVDEAKEILNW